MGLTFLFLFLLLFLLCRALVVGGGTITLSSIFSSYDSSSSDSLPFCHCVTSVQIRSFFWSVFSSIRTKSGEILLIFTYSVHMRENADQKKLHIWTLFMQCEYETTYSSCVLQEINWSAFSSFYHLIVLHIELQHLLIIQYVYKKHHHKLIAFIFLHRFYIFWFSLMDHKIFQIIRFWGKRKRIIILFILLFVKTKLFVISEN